MSDNNDNRDKASVNEGDNLDKKVSACCPLRRCGRLTGWLLGNDRCEDACDLALLVLRLMVGAIFLYHGLQKGFGWFGGPGWAGALGAAGATGLKPAAFWAFMLVLAEAGGGLALLLGIAVRIGAALNGFVMFMALLTAHRGAPFAETHSQQMLLAACVALVIAGGGGLSLWPRRCQSKPSA